MGSAAGAVLLSGDLVNNALACDWLNYAIPSLASLESTAGDVLITLVPVTPAAVPRWMVRDRLSGLPTGGRRFLHNQHNPARAAKDQLLHQLLARSAISRARVNASDEPSCSWSGCGHH